MADAASSDARCSTRGSTGRRSSPSSSRSCCVALLAGEPPAAADDDARARRVRRRPRVRPRLRPPTGSPTASPTAGPARPATSGWPTRRRRAAARSAGFRVRTIVHDGETIDGKRRAADRRRRARRAPSTSGSSSSPTATRRAARAAAELSGTAALLELARVFGAPRQTQRTLTLVSTSGGSGGAAGARARSPTSSARPVAGVLVLGDLASRNAPRAAARRRGPTGWAARAAAAARARSRRRCAWRPARRRGPPRALSQFARFALPATYGEQGALLAARPARDRCCRSAASAPPRRRRAGLARAAGGARPRRPAHGHRARRRAARTARRRAGLQRGPAHRAARCCRAGRCGCSPARCCCAPLVAAIDALARVRRAREPVAARGCAGRSAARCRSSSPRCSRSRWAPSGCSPRRPARRSPRARCRRRRRRCSAVGLVLVLALGVAAARRAAPRPRSGARRPGEPGGGRRRAARRASRRRSSCGSRNPYAAALLVPALHLWLFALAPELAHAPRRCGSRSSRSGSCRRARRGRRSPRALGLGPLDAAWALLLVVAGGHVSCAGVLLWSLLGGCGARGPARSPRAAATRADADALPITVRGPRSYAGPARSAAPSRPCGDDGDGRCAGRCGPCRRS